jgi:hypothetical protein
MAGIRQHGRFSFLDFVAEKPWLRKAILKVEGDICTVQLGEGNTLGNTKNYSLIRYSFI